MKSCSISRLILQLSNTRFLMVLIRSMSFTVNERVVKETGNLDLDLSKIPDGMYYTTIAWFIDGTYVMGGVHQKGVEE